MKTSRRFRNLGLMIGAALVLAMGPLANRAEAFGPAAHYGVMEQVTQALPQGSSIRSAMEHFPTIAAAAASGPDIPYCQIRGAFGYAPWADRFHYDRVGTFAKTQLQKALASGDEKQIAWAAGRKLHKALEQAAESYVWVEIGGHPEATYNASSLSPKFCGSSDIQLTLLNDASSQVYGSNPGGDYRTWYQLFKTGLSKGVAYTYQKYPEAQKFLAVSDRRSRLTQATAAAVKQASGLLQAAENGDYGGFSDAWNLDAGNDGRPFGTLTVSVTTADESGAGTDADIYFGLTFANGVTKEWLLDKDGHNDFEQGDKDDYYLFLADKNCEPSKVTGVYLRMGAKHGLAAAWKVDSMGIRINGVEVFAQEPNLWLKETGDRWQSAAWNELTKSE